ncbi:NUDIX domain-containing protein [Streptomyces xiaopingdaonensis]|uniref:NUDIX domain-containing protein n=1 Tax=Streptomyces xiaopingdaonensis TaxID=1565415 RepID=UPI00030D61E1|nr:NUDIX hydrolase [Streptomyces xiaopingdaonensis]
MADPAPRPHPVPPAEYVRTLPHHTVYGCLDVRDERGRPLLLRSVHVGQVWQLPGGNAEHGEAPWRTTRREAVEGTGLGEFGDLEPRPFLAHFVHPAGEWPLPKTGLVADGGRLTAVQRSRIRLDPDENCR